MKKTPLSEREELQRILSKRGFASRSKAAALIEAGKVLVDGRAVRKANAYVSTQAVIHVDGVLVHDNSTAETMLVALHKPKGFVTTTADEKGRETVFELLPKKYQHLKAIGRLDIATSGLLLFTNNHHLADALLDPKNKIPRRYVVKVRGSPSSELIQTLISGIESKGETLSASDVTVRKQSGKETTLILTLDEGRNREIRRMGEAIGHEVIALKRISFGTIELGELKSGTWVELPIPETMLALTRRS